MRQAKPKPTDDNGIGRPEQTEMKMNKVEQIRQWKLYVSSLLSSSSCLLKVALPGQKWASFHNSENRRHPPGSKNLEQSMRALQQPNED